MAESERRRSRFQISLRMLLIVITLASLLFACHHRYARQHRTAELLREYGAKITYRQPPIRIRWIPWVRDWARDVTAVDLAHQKIDSDAIQLLHRFPRLERLYLSRTNLREADLWRIGKLTKLKRLSLWGTTISDWKIDDLAGLTELEVLDVHDTRLSDTSLATFAQLPRLRELKFDFDMFSDEGLISLSKMPSLPWGELTCYRVTDRGLNALRNVPAKNYRITGLIESDVSDEALLSLVASDGMLPVGPAFHVRQSPISDRVLDSLPWPALTDVRFVETKVTFDAVAERIGERMRVLNIGNSGFRIAEGRQKKNGYSWQVTGTSVWLDEDAAELTSEQLSRLPNLTAVSLDRRASAGEVLMRLSRHSQITHFEMGYVPKHTPVIEHISNWKQLRALSLNCCNPRTDFDMSPLARLKQLRSLEFFCTPFDDGAFETFGQLPELRSMTLYGADKVTGTGLIHLRDLPQLRVVTIQSQANWDRAIRSVMSLEQVPKLTLLGVKMNNTNLGYFRSRKGWFYRP